jgi:hypothetical protein
MAALSEPVRQASAAGHSRDQIADVASLIVAEGGFYLGQVGQASDPPVAASRWFQLS